MRSGPLPARSAVSARRRSTARPRTQPIANQAATMPTNIGTAHVAAVPQLAAVWRRAWKPTHVTPALSAAGLSQR